MRAMNLADVLVQRGHKVVLWSADYDHQKKCHRFGKYHAVQVHENLAIRLIASRGYKRHIGFGRLLDHMQLAFNLKRLLQSTHDTPDVAFIGYPPIETAAIFIKWLKRRHVPSLLDVKDIWPELFLSILPKYMAGIGRVIFYPYFYLAKQAMQHATAICSPTPSFLTWSLTFAGREKTPQDTVARLTTANITIDNKALLAANQWCNEIGINDDTINIYFAGGLSRGYDFSPIKEAVLKLNKTSFKVKFIICGDGYYCAQVKAMMQDVPNVIFTDWIDQFKIKALAQRCQASIAPFMNTGYTMNIPNKIVDALAFGLPILSPLNGEVERLIEEHKVGLHYNANDGEKDLYQCLLMLKDQQLQQTMSHNAKKLYDDQFSFDKVYGGLAQHIERMAVKNFS